VVAEDTVEFNVTVPVDDAGPMTVVGDRLRLDTIAPGLIVKDDVRG